MTAPGAAGPQHLGDEQRLLDVEGAEGAGAVARGPGQGRVRRAVAGLVGLAAVGAAAVFVGRRVSGSEDGGPAAAKASDATEFVKVGQDPLGRKKDYDLREDRRKRLAIEENLADHISEDDIPDAIKEGPQDEDDPQQMSARLFDHLLLKSKLHMELTHGERRAFRDRFVAHMVKRAKSQRWAMGVAGFRQFLHAAKAVIEHEKPVVTEAFVESLNGAKMGFRAKMLPWMIHESKAAFQSRLGRKPVDEEVVKEAKRTMNSETGRRLASVRVPEQFDPRQKWPECADVFSCVHNQGHCGSCWIFAALGAVDGRMCIAEGGRFSGAKAQLSRGYAASCVLSGGNGCGGGWEYQAYQYIERTEGVPSTQCSPYFAFGAGTEHFQHSQHSPPCPTECHYQYTRTLSEDMFQPMGMADYQLILSPQDNGGIPIAKASMFQHGPLTFGIYASNNFMAYSSGVFSLDCGYSANHAVLAIGWGVDQGTEYLLATNSWGEEWGEDGHFRVGWCVPTDFTIPGPITRAKCPVPFPDHTRGTTARPLPPAAPPRSAIPCPTLADGCITSPQYPQHYLNSQECTIGYDFGKINVVYFETEADYDFFEINGEQYSGTHGPQGVEPYTNIVWSSDYSNPSKGWKICPM